MAVTIKANASGNAGDASKWNEDPGDAITYIDLSNPSFSIDDDHTGRFGAGVFFNVSGHSDPATNGEYVVVSSSYWGGKTEIIVTTSINSSEIGGTITVHRVPDATDTVDINGKTIVWAGATAAAEIQDVATGGTLVVAKAIPAATTITAVALDVLPQQILSCGE